LEVARVRGIVISSVVPPLDTTLREVCEKYFGTRPLFIEPGVKTGMPVVTYNPYEVGADRIVNGVAAYATWGGPVVVVDFGTATTFDVVTARGEYAGGVICPGVGISADALFQRAARLPRVDVRRPSRVIGRSTVGSMQAGLYFGYCAMVEGLLARIRAELGGGARTVATGGLAETLAGDLPSIEAVDPVLTLTGLRLIWERHRPGPPP
jgi:type III pantothenate kinase